MGYFLERLSINIGNFKIYYMNYSNIPIIVDDAYFSKNNPESQMGHF